MVFFDAVKNFCTLFFTDNVQHLKKVLFWLFWFSIFLFPLGYVTREVMPSLCLLVLLRYYQLNWKSSLLRRFSPKYLFYLFFIGIFIGIAFSMNPLNSFLYVFKHINTGFVYPLVAMECIDSTEDLEKLVWAFLFASIWEGADGIFQSITGYDFIDHTPTVQVANIANGRLTGSLNDYRVGNYMALTIIPASALFVLLRKTRGVFRSTVTTFIALFPGFYLVYFSYTRNAYFTLVVAALALFMLYSRRIHWKQILLACTGLVGIMAVWVLIVPERFGLHIILRDGRWELWQFAWAVFLKHPWTGVGFWNYNTAFRSLGLVPVRDLITISHPHDIYLQILCESGILGALCIYAFLFGFLGWGFRRVQRGLRCSTFPPLYYHWKLTSFFWVAWLAYLASGVVGHDFFRDWWFAQVMILFGIMIAACSCPKADYNSG